MRCLILVAVFVSLSGAKYRLESAVCVGLAIYILAFMHRYIPSVPIAPMFVGLLLSYDSGVI